MFKILSLDGGGIRGAFIASFLAKIQENLNEPIADHFDLIAGTSTGGLIAVALGLGIHPNEILRLYNDKGTEIFARRSSRLSAISRFAVNKCIQKFAPGSELDADWIADSKYEATGLKQALEESVGNRLLGEARRRLVIPAVDLTADKIIVFKTPHRPNFVRDLHYRAVDVMLATSAAPTYFPIASIMSGSAYCDGGVWANNPAMVAYVEAIRISRECTREGVDPVFNANDIEMLSVGTGKTSYFSRPDPRSSGLKWWAPKLFNVTSSAQSEGIHDQMLYLLGANYSRIDFSAPNIWSLDAHENLPELIHLGGQQATQNFPNLRPKFFQSVTQPYTPYVQ